MSVDPHKKFEHPFEKFRPYVFACISACSATAVVQPMDTTKVRIQAISEYNSTHAAEGEKLQSTKPFKVAKQILKNSGPKGFYHGLDAAIMRQVVYGTIRLGMFMQMSDEIKHRKKRNLTFLEKSFCSLFSGMVGSIIGNPADVALVRFQADTLLPVEQRRNYKNVGDAVTRMIKEEGVLSLWRGCTPTVIRAMIMNFGMLASYDTIKELVISYTNDSDAQSTKVISSIFSGVIATFVSLPPDNIKTKLMKMKPQADGTMPYKGFIDCVVKTAKREGILGYWVGVSTYFMRVTPHAIVSLLIQDELTQIWKHHLSKKAH